MAGVIWSPADQVPDRLAERITSTDLSGCVQAIDPQLYIARLADAAAKKLADHGVVPVPIRARDLSARRLPDLVSRVMNHQAQFGEITHLLAPSVAIPSMADRSAQTAIDLADAAVAWKDDGGDARPILLTLALQQSFLADADSVDGLLDEITGFDCDGFYLLFELPPDADRSVAAPLIQRALYAVNVLADNDFSVWVGYVGLGGYAMRAAGAEAVATGWFQKQQWWSPSHWTPSSGGRQPRPRAFLPSVANSLILSSELDPLSRADAALYRAAIDGSGPISTDLRGGRSPADTFHRGECVEQLFATLAEFESRITGSVEDDLRQVRDDLEDAVALIETIDGVIGLEPKSGTRGPGAWLDAVDSVADELGFVL